MYERFTDRARKVMQLANQEAQRLNHQYIGTEHILLGLVKEGSGVAANVLKNLDIDLRKIRLEVEKIVQSGPDIVTIGKLPQTPRAKKVIEYSIEEARNLNHNYVGTEHLLLGLLRENGGVAAEILGRLGLSTEKVREATIALLNNPPAWPSPRRRRGRCAQLGAHALLFIFCGGLLAPFAGFFHDYVTTGKSGLTDGALATGLGYIAGVAIASWQATWPKGRRSA
jgi:ATP-dependent Clp protease ATP-binding subunit ClpC